MTSYQDFDLNFLPHDVHAFDLNEIPSIEQHEEEYGVYEGNNLENISGDISSDEEVHLSGDAENVVISEGETQPRTNRFLSNEERKQIYDALLQRSVNGKLKRDTMKEVSFLFSVPLKTVQRIWKRAKDTPNDTCVNVSHRKTKNCGRKRVEVKFNAIINVPLNRRTTIRSLAQALNVSPTTVHRSYKRDLLHRHSNAIKPQLKEEHKIKRLRFCISMLDPSSLPQDPKFIGMYNVVHIDEKWLTKKSNSYYLLPNEEDPLRSCQSKNFIGKVMFLAAIARPRFDDEVFSGKIGVFPFVTLQPAVRRSQNRAAETIETKPITSVKKETIHAFFLLEKVISAIQAKWPSEDARDTIFIQQDNSRTHVQPTDEGFQMVASQNGFDIRLLCQPANSPDMNVLDLGFLNAIQSMQDKVCARSVNELISAVLMAFDEYPTQKINHVFLSMREVMRVQGSNQYKIPHINKARLERDGHLPTQVTCDYDLVENTRNMLQSIDELGE